MYINLLFIACSQLANNIVLCHSPYTVDKYKDLCSALTITAPFLLISLADEVSLADPDDILDRFMAKQRYNRFCN